MGAGISRVLCYFATCAALLAGALRAGAEEAATTDRPLVLMPAAAGGRRVALVIGNAAYAVGRLKNPANDAPDMAAALKATGFEVLEHRDLDQAQMVRAIREFGERLRGAAVALFYYSGHGMQYEGRNYLIPVDMKAASEAEVESDGVELAKVLSRMETAGAPVNLVILDACRTNPMTRSFRSQAAGLAAVDATHGTLIAYATAPGSTAADGSGRNGTYTGALLEEMRRPGQKVEEVFKRVRGAVRGATGGKQVPWESSSLEGDFYFVAPGPAAAAAAAPPVPAAPAPRVDESAVELTFWNSVKDSQDAAEFEAYLQKYPKGEFATLARKRAKALKAAAAPPRPTAA
ncbi:MAG: caspase family protein [Deltaproteobacteria bacterium]|nr:caspase family protein [Deltaproteobacteria bacterium]